MRELTNINERYVYGGIKNIATSYSDASLSHNVTLARHVEKIWTSNPQKTTVPLKKALEQVLYIGKDKSIAALVYLPFNVLGYLDDEEGGADYIYIYKGLDDPHVYVTIASDDESSLTCPLRAYQTGDVNVSFKYESGVSVEKNVDNLLKFIAESLSVEELVSCGVSNPFTLAKVSTIIPVIATLSKSSAKKYYSIVGVDDCVEIPGISPEVENESPEQNIIDNQTGDVKMSKVAKVVDANKAAAITAGKLVAGKIAIKNVTKLVTPRLPMMVRGYADSAVGQLVLANLFKFAVENYAPGNKNAVLVADAMLEGAMVSALEGFNIEQMISQVLEGVDIGKLAAAPVVE